MEGIVVKDTLLLCESDTLNDGSYISSIHCKNVVYQNTPGEQYFTVSMVTVWVTMETVKYCSLGVSSYTVFFTV